MRPAEGQGYMPHVDGLRTVAVIGVLLAHFGIPGFPGGFLGVDVFFVISGFLITRLIAQQQTAGRFSWKTFYLRRIRRLLPAALATVAVSLLALWPVMSAQDFTAFLKSVPFAIFSLSNIHFYQEIGYFDVGTLYKPLLHTWSLAVEEQFYLFWPAILVLCLVFARRLTLAITLGLGGASMVAAQIWLSRDASAVYYLLPFRAFELMTGAALALGGPVRAERAASGYALLGLGLILASYFLLDDHSPMPGVLSLLPCVGTALVIAFGHAGPVGRILTMRPVIWIGLISYSLYLVHWPLAVYVFYRLPGDPGLWVRLALFPLAISLAALSYYIVEKRFRHPAPEGARFGNLPFLAGAAVMVVICILPVALRAPAAAPLLRAITGEPDPAFTRSWVPMPGSPWNRPMLRLAARTEGPRILIMGDSHSEQLRPGVETLLTPQGISADIADLAGCPPLFGTWVLFGNPDPQRQRACRVHAEAREKLALSGSYDAVILAARWELVTEPKLGIDAPQRLVTEDQPGDRGLEASRAIFETSLERTIDSLLAQGRKVIVLDQVPPPGVDLSRCAALWTQTAMPGGDTVRCTGLSEAEKAARADYTSAQLRQLRSKGPGVMVIMPRDIFCPNGTCLTRNATGEVLYRDDNHLSDAGSLMLVAAIRDELDHFIRSTGTEKDGK